MSLKPFSALGFILLSACAAAGPQHHSGRVMSQAEYLASNRTPDCEELSHPDSRASCIRRRDAQLVFNPSDHETYSGAGRGAVQGQAFLRQRGGGVVTCAGSQVFLIPSTPYFHQALRSFSSIENAQFSINAEQYRKRTTCDAQGNFRFDAIPDGTWLVVTEVRWHVGHNSQGGALKSEVIVSEGGKTEVFLTDANRYWQ